MITIVPTQKLFYNRFTHCIKVNFINDKNFLKSGDQRLADIKTWLTDNSVAHRTRIDWQIIGKGLKIVDVTMGIYMSDATAFEQLMNKYSHLIKWASKPTDDAHRDLLLNKTEIEFREKLYYKKFRYKILFNPVSSNARSELIDSIHKMMPDKENGRARDYVFINNWSPALYIQNDEDMVLFKLSMSENIRRITRVELFEEHGMISTATKP